MRKLTFFILFITIFLFSGCQKNDNDKLNIVVSITPQIEFVQSICKDLAIVTSIIPIGYSPETYEPSIQEMMNINSSDIYFKIGVPVEDNLIDALDENLLIVDLASEVRNEFTDLNINEARDPHIWLSIKRVKIMINQIYESIILIDPENQAFYEQNKIEYLNNLDLANQHIVDIFEGYTNRKFIVFHPAFQYFANEYALEMYAIEKEGSEATIQDLIDMIDFAKENNIKVVFNQAEVDSSWVTSFTEEIKGGTFILLSPLASNYIDNLKDMADKIASSLS